MKSIHYSDAARRLADDALLAAVNSLAARGRGAGAELVAHLAELETRGLHLAAGHGSLFAYCCDVLLLSEHEAYHRIEAARAARRFPVIVELLAQGAINLTTVRLLGRHLTHDNHLEVLEAARGLKKAQVEELAARLAPAPDVSVSIRKIPTPTPRPSPVVPVVLMAQPSASGVESRSVTDAAVATAGGEAATISALVGRGVAMPPAASPIGLPTVPPTVPAAAGIAAVSTLSPNRYKIQMTIGGDTLEKLRLAKDLLRHAIPTGDDAAIVDRALTALLDDLMKKKFAAIKARGLSSSPGSGPTPPSSPGAKPGAGSRSRHIPAEVRRAVFLRDRGHCAFVGTAGRRCRERAFVEFHHVRPYAEGGPATVANIELRCRRHNGYEWRRRSVDVRVLEEQWYVSRADAGAQGTLEGTSSRPSP